MSFEKFAKELTSKTRNALPDSAFVFPGERKFPIHDEAHAKSALSYAHTASDPEKVRREVYAKYPHLKKSHDERMGKAASVSSSIAQKIAVVHPSKLRKVMAALYKRRSDIRRLLNK